jgi:hypothetical protein
MHGIQIEQVSYYDLRPHVTQAPSPIILCAYHCTDGFAFFQQHFGESSSDPTNTACCPGNQNRIRHSCSFQR